MCLTVDNGPNMILGGKLLKESKKIQHLNRCSAHLFQRVILYGIANSEFSLGEKIIKSKEFIDGIR